MSTTEHRTRPTLPAAFEQRALSFRTDADARAYVFRLWVDDRVSTAQFEALTRLLDAKRRRAKAVMRTATTVIAVAEAVVLLAGIVAIIFLVAALPH